MTAVGEAKVIPFKRAERTEEVTRYNIRRFMSLCGYNQGDLAEIWGVTRGAVSQRLTGYSQLKFTEVVLAAEWLGVSINDLMNDSYLRQDEELMEKMRGNTQKNKKAPGDPEASDELLRLGLNQRPSD